MVSTADGGRFFAFAAVRPYHTGIILNRTGAVDGRQMLPMISCAFTFTY